MKITLCYWLKLIHLLRQLYDIFIQSVKRSEMAGGVPLSLFEWLKQIFQPTIRIEQRTAISSIRTDPTLNDIDLLKDRKYHFETVITPGPGYLSIDFPATPGTMRIIRDVTVSNISHAETCLPSVVYYKDGVDGQGMYFPIVPVTVATGADLLGPTESAMLRVRNDVILIYGGVLRVWAYGAAARTLRFQITYDEVSL